MNQTATQADAAATKRRTRKAEAAKPAGRRRVRVAEGVYPDRHGLAATVKVNGVQREIRFPAGTPLKTIRAKRDELRASLRTVPAGERHTLAHDAARYLQQVSGEPVSIADRRHHIDLWTACFGHIRTLELPQYTAALNDQAAPVARDAVRVRLQPSARRAHEPRQDPVRPPRRGRIRGSRPVRAAATEAALDRAHAHRGRAGAIDARVQNRSTLTAHALDRHAAFPDGAIAAGGLPPQRADAVRRRATRQGRTAGGDPAGR